MMTAVPALDEPHPVRLTIADFLCLDSAGALDRYAKTELIEGVIVAVNAQFSTHARTKTRLLRRLADAVDAGMPAYEAWSEVSVAIPPMNLPEPDIVVTSFTPVAGRAPVPVETIAIIVEVADTTLSHDLRTKVTVYARAGIPEYWVVDVEAKVIHQMWAPAGETYAERREMAIGDRIAAATVEGLTVETAGI